jgi:hypothetical protein
MVGQHAGNPPSTHLRGLGSTCSSPAPPPTDRHLALDRLPWSARRRARRRSLDACEAAPSLASTLVRATHGQRSTIFCPPGPIRAATTKPLTDHSDPSNPVHQPWPVPPHRCIPDPARLQRPRTPDACPSGHPDHTGRVDTRRMDTGRMDTGRADTGRPPDQLDGRPSAWRTADANRATNGVAGVRTSWTARRRRPPDGQPKLARVAASAALGNPITPPQ